MAHPMKKEGVDGHNEKLRKLTRDYGDADPSMRKSAPVNRFKEEGPEDDVGFGVEYDKVKARSDRPARKSIAANPLATYKKGGRVKQKVRKRADGGPAAPLRDYSSVADREELAARRASLEEELSRDMAGRPLPPLAMENVRGGSPSPYKSGGKVKNRARGGAMKGKGTNVNIIISPQGSQPGGDAAGPMMPPPVLPLGAGLGGPPVIPPGMPPPRPLMGGGLPMAPGGMPPGIMPPRANGGRVMTAGAESGPGRLQKTAWRARRAKREYPQEV